MKAKELTYKMLADFVTSYNQTRDWEHVKLRTTRNGWIELLLVHEFADVYEPSIIYKGCNVITAYKALKTFILLHD